MSELKLIAPIAVTDAMFTYTDVPEADYAEYAAGTTYGDGDTKMITTAGIHKIYESLKAGNTGNYPPSNLTGVDPWWLEISATNRWKAFDAIVGTQTSKATSFFHTIQPGAVFDSVAVHNVAATSVRITVANQAANLIVNGTLWTGATGVTPPTGWDLVATPELTIDNAGSIKTIKIDASGGASVEGISQTVVVTPGTSYQLLLQYRNTPGDFARVAVYDVTHSLDILAEADLPANSTGSDGALTSYSYIFTAPAGCTSVKLSILVHSVVGDYAWFDAVALSPIVYDVTDSTGMADIAVTDIPAYSGGSVTIRVTGGTARAGDIVVGNSSNLGTVLADPNPETGIVDYSVKTIDSAGYYTFVPGAYSKTMELTTSILTSAADAAELVLVAYRGQVVSWVGDATKSSMIIKGKYNSYRMGRGLNVAFMPIEIEGVI